MLISRAWRFGDASAKSNPVCWRGTRETGHAPVFGVEMFCYFTIVEFLRYEMRIVQGSAMS